MIKKIMLTICVFFGALCLIIILSIAISIYINKSEPLELEQGEIFAIINLYSYNNKKWNLLEWSEHKNG